jgi:hypothetical protein
MNAKSKNMDPAHDEHGRRTAEPAPGLVAKIREGVGAKRAARFDQVDNHLSMMVNVKLASEIPLVP